MLSAKEKEIVEVLRPLEVATRELCAQKYVTASKVIPLIHGIENEITKLTPGQEAEETQSKLNLICICISAELI